MVKKKALVWECECGNIEYGSLPPEECSECSSLNSFLKVPDEMVEGKMEENILKSKTFEEEEEDED